MEGLRTISTMEELEDYFSVVCRKIEDALADQVTIDSSLIKPLVFKVMTSVGEPYIDTYWMRAFVNFSDKLVDIMQVATQKTLSEEEKKSFQLRVYVKKGSNIYELSMQFADFFNKSGVMEILPEMSFGQLLSIVVPATIGITFAYCFNRKEKEKTVRERNNLEAQIENKKTEAETVRLKAGQDIQAKMLENQVQVLEVVRDILDRGDKAGGGLARDILKNPDLPDSIFFNGGELRKADLKELGKVSRPRKEKRREMLDAWFKADKLDYNNPEGNEYYFEAVECCIKDCRFRKDLFSPAQQYAIDKRYKIRMRLSCIVQDGVYHMADGVVNVLGFKDDAGKEMSEAEIKAEMEGDPDL